MEQQHEPITDLMKFPLFSAQIKTDFQPFSYRLIEGGCAGGCIPLPKRGDSHGCGMPVEMIGFSNGGFLESLFEEAIESSAGGCHAPSFGTAGWDGNRLRDFLINLSRRETRVDVSLEACIGSVPLRLLALCS